MWGIAENPSHKLPVLKITRNFDIWFDVILNKLFNKQLQVPWDAMTFMWRHCDNAVTFYNMLPVNVIFFVPSDATFVGSCGTESWRESCYKNAALTIDAKVCIVTTVCFQCVVKPWSLRAIKSPASFDISWSRLMKYRTAILQALLGGINHIIQWLCYLKLEYRQTSNIRRTLVGCKIVDHSGVVGASPVGAAPTTSSLST